MASGRRLKVVVLGGVGAMVITSSALALSYQPKVQQAGYGPFGCPTGWDHVSVSAAGNRGIAGAGGYDRNGNNFICVRAVNGLGNTGSGYNARDDNAG